MKAGNAVLLLAVLAPSPHMALGTADQKSTGPVDCDVLVAGGSTAALAAAITAAEADPDIHVCLTEPTDGDVGGQMSSSGVSAIDFGSDNRKPENQPASFRELIAFLNQQIKPGCWVSYTCYNPRRMVYWAQERITKSSNLHLLDRTVVRAATTLSDGTVDKVTLVQRTPRAGVDEWDTLLSESITDWYSPDDSPRFTKTVWNVSASVVVDATEFGDVLMTAGFEVGQGIEIPTEDSATTDDQCGQAATLTFFMEFLASKPSSPDPAPPGGTEGGAPFSAAGCCCPTENVNNKTFEAGSCDYRGIWTYRRASALSPARSYLDVNVGDVSQQNWGNPSGNDLDSAYMFLPLSEARASVSAHSWSGGINLTALSMLEQRAFGWFHAYAAAFPADIGSRMVINRQFTNTTTGLSKLPYLRDSRRSIGLKGYRLMHNDETGPTNGVAARPVDAVAFGNYPADDHNIHTCSAPSYMSSAQTVPYYIPFRALTHRDAPNLLLAGKTMATTFYANSASRLHPTEWSSGVASGAAAVLMLRHRCTTNELYENYIPDVQLLLNSSSVGAPLTWDV